MNGIIMYESALVVVIIVVTMLIGKVDIKAALFAMGTVLMHIVIAMGNSVTIKELKSTGLIVLSPLKAVTDQFKGALPAAGFIILILGGYPAYMMSTDVNEVTAHTLTKPIKKIRSVYILVPLVFLIGDIPSLVTPGASNLVIILPVALYPISHQADMSPSTAAVITVTTATVTPTLLGGDNVAVAIEPAEYPAFADMSTTDYVIQYHAMILAPTLIVMAIVHFFQQKFMDKKNTGKLEDNVEVREVRVILESGLYRFVYTLLLIFPILLLIVIYITHSVTESSVDVSVEAAPLFSLLIAVVCEIIRTKDSGKVLKQTENFFKGMGSSVPIVALLVATSVFVLGLNSTGLIDALQTIMFSIQGPGMGFVPPLILMEPTIPIVLLSGSGAVLSYVMVPLMVPLTEAAGISAVAVSVPMGLRGNLIRAVSLVAVVVIIIAGTIKTDPLDITKRTSVPIVAGVVTMFVLSMITLL